MNFGNIRKKIISVYSDYPPPPHSTHLTQPLDVGVFQPMKHYHAEAVDNAIRLGDVDFNRLDFLAAFNQFVQRHSNHLLSNQPGKKLG